MVLQREQRWLGRGRWQSAWESTRKTGRKETEIKADSHFPGLSMPACQKLVLAFTEKGQAEEGTDWERWE